MFGIDRSLRSVLSGMNRLLAGMAIAALGPVSGVLAQSMDYGGLEKVFGEPVTTSVTGSPQRASDVPASMEIITAEEIRRSGAKDIPGILRHVTGVNVARWTNDHADVSVRGYNKAFSSRLLVLINGRQVYADHYGYTPWSSLPVELGEIRQIEVVKGPNSALFGFNAVGGVINIITHNPIHDDTDFATVRAGTQDQFEGSGAVTVPFGDGHAVRLSGSGRQNDDFSTPLLPANEGVRRGQKKASAGLDAHFTVSPNVELEIEGSYTDSDQTSMAPNYTMGFEKLTTKSLKGRLSADTRYGLIEATVYRNWLDNDVFGGTDTTSLVNFRNRLTVAKLQDIFKIGADHTVRLSGEFRHSSLNTTPVEGGTVFYDVYSGGAMWNWRMTQNLALTNAVRVDSLDLGRKGSIPPVLGLANSDWDRSMTEVSFNSGLVWHMSDKDTFRLTAARGAQLPNLFDLGGNVFEFPIPPGFGLIPGLYYFTGLPSLDPTTVTNYEFAWDRQIPSLGAEMNLAVFHGITRDVLADYGAFSFENNILSAPANIGKSKAIGFEASLKGTFLEHWRWGLGYIYEDIDDNFAAQFTPNFSFVDFENTTPEHMVNARLGWGRGPWEIDGFLRYKSDRQGIRVAQPFVPGVDVLTPLSDYVTVDARIAYTVDDWLTLAVSGQNLLSKEQEQTGGPRVERRVLGTITTEF